ncbi:hypothetical protein [Streptomyces sp. NPDC088246]|uniref:hypothetical protein n=1 Tax=Streptomyces sp. NPDC088246 TaxID=3365842 RepID=UPI0037FEFF07
MTAWDQASAAGLPASSRRAPIRRSSGPVERRPGVVHGRRGGAQGPERQVRDRGGGGFGAAQQQRQRLLVAERDAQGPPAQERGLGAQPRVLGQVADPAADLADPLWMAGEHGRLRGHQQAPGAQVRRRGQIGGAFQRRRGRRVPAPGTRPFGTLRQGVGVGDVCVLARRGGGQVPRPAVRFLGESGGQREMGLPALGEGSRLVDGRTHQRMAQQHLAVLDPHQSDALRGVQWLDGVQRRGGAQEIGELPGAGGRDQEQRLTRGLGQAGEAGGKQVLQACGERQGGTAVLARAGPAPGEGPRQLDQGQRVAGGLLEDLGAGPAAGRVRLGVQQQTRRRPAQRAHSHLGEVPVEAGRHALLAGGEQHHHRFALQAPGEEAQHVHRAEVEPLDVVHEQEQWLVRGGVADEGEHADAQRHLVESRLVVSRRHPEGAVESLPLLGGQCATRKQRMQELVDTLEPQPGLALAAAHPQGPQTPGPALLGRPVDEGALARPRLPDQRQHLRAGAVHRPEQHLDAGQLGGPAEDARIGGVIGTNVHHGRSPPAGDHAPVILPAGNLRTCASRGTADRPWPTVRPPPAAPVPAGTGGGGRLVI